MDRRANCGRAKQVGSPRYSILARESCNPDILNSVNKRATSWLLATLMALCAVHAVPAVRAQRTGENCPIVWVARARAEQRVLVARRSTGGYPRVVVALRPESVSAAGRLVAHSLYQRPPPFSLN